MRMIKIIEKEADAQSTFEVIAQPCCRWCGKRQFEFFNYSCDTCQYILFCSLLMTAAEFFIVLSLIKYMCK